MQRLYRVLLLISLATGVAVCLRPSVVEELTAFALGGSPLYAQQASPAPYMGYQPMMRPSYAAPAHAQPWASSPTPPVQQAGAMGEAEVSDAPYVRNNSDMPVPPGYAPAISGPQPTYPPYNNPPYNTSSSPTDRFATPSHQPPKVVQAGTVRPPAAPPPAHQDAKEQAPEASEAELCEGAQILARVGPKVILASEVMAPINEIMAQHKDKIPPAQLEIQRKLLMQKLLEQRIDIKLVYYDAERKIPKENVDKIKERLSEQFELMEVPRRIKDAELDSRRELEEKMLGLGTSLEREKRAFTERVVAQQWIQQQATANDEISHEEMLAYYQDHLTEFEHSARARWEQLLVRKAGRQSAAEARTALGRMGNEVLSGTPLAQVAKKHSQGPTASKGGTWDWTSKGSLVSEALDQAIFGLPVGQLSQIIEDAQGYHIVRVIEREDASRTPFVEAQVQIRKKIREQREKEARAKYLTKLREEIPVWTIFDSEIAQKPNSSAPFSPSFQR